MTEHRPVAEMQARMSMLIAELDGDKTKTKTCLTCILVSAGYDTDTVMKVLEVLNASASP